MIILKVFAATALGDVISNILLLLIFCDHGDRLRFGKQLLDSQTILHPLLSILTFLKRFWFGGPSVKAEIRLEVI